MTSTKLSIFIFSFTLLSACSEKNGEEYIEIASKYQSDGNHQAATIALKNAIKQDSYDTVAREMLGNIYLEQGLYTAAEKELSRAKTESSKVGLAESLLWQEKYAEVQELIVSDSQGNRTNFETVEVYKAIAVLRQGNTLRSREIFTTLKKNSEHTETSKLASAYLAVLNNNSEQAVNELEECLAINPNYLPALQLKANIEIQQKQWSKAIDSLEFLLSLRKADYKIKLKLSDALINNGEFLAAEPIVDELLKISSEQAYFNQLKGTIEFSKGNFQTSLNNLDKAIKNGGSNAQVRLLAALANYNIGSIEQAYQNLSVVINEFSKDHFAYKLFTMIQLQLGYDAEASESASLIPDLDENDLSFVIKASNSFLNTGDAVSAKLLLNQIDTKNVKDSRVLRALGSLKILANDKSGIENLENSYLADPNSSEALFLLASAYIDSGDFGRALELTDSWLKENSNDIAVINLKARTYTYMHKMGMAEKTYKDSLAIDETNPSALLFLAEQSIKRDNIETAIQHLENLVKGNPLNIHVLVKYFQFHELLGNHERALVPLRKAANSSAGDIRYDLIYAGALATQSKTDEQLTHLLSIEDEGKNAPKFWMLLGDAYWEKGNIDKSINAYAKWLDNEKSVNAFVKNIRVAEISGDLPRALRLTDQFAMEFPDQKELDLLRAHVLILNKKFDRAQRILTSTSAQMRSTVSWLFLQGQLLLAKQEYQKAEDMLHQSYLKAPIPETARYLYTALIKQNKYDGGIEFAHNHLKQNPEDSVLRLMVASQLLRQDQSKAIAHFEYLALSSSQADPLVLNNLAWLLVENNRATEALQYIEEALELLPQNPNILATAGNTYASLEDYDKAIVSLKSAHEKAPSSFEITIDYIKVLNKSGNNEYAKSIFAKLKPTNHAQEMEARALYEKIEE